MPDLTIWFSRADFVEMGEFLAEEGSNFGKVLVVYPLLRLPPFTGKPKKYPAEKI